MISDIQHEEDNRCMDIIEKEIGVPKKERTRRREARNAARLKYLQDMGIAEDILDS